LTKNTAISLGLVAGLALGLIASATNAPLLNALAHGVRPIGDAFLNLIRVIVVPLVATTLFSGVAALGGPKQLGRLGGLTLAFYWGTTFIAIVMGMLITAAALPLAGAPMVPTTAEALVTPELPGLVDFLVGLVPSNVIATAAAGDLLPLMVFTVLFGAAAAVLPPAEKRRLLDFADTLTNTFITLVHWILWTAPLGVFALAAPVAADTGLDMIRGLAVFVAAVAVGLVLFVATVYLPAARFLGGVRAADFLKANLEVAPIAFSTTSSAATLPALYDAAANTLRTSPAINSFVLPLGAVLNRSGSALFQGSAIVFLAHLYGVSLAPTALLGAVFATFLVALTVVGVPSSSIMTLPPALAATGLPLDGMAILLGVDRIPDMLRTAVNVSGDLVAAAIMDTRLSSPTDARVEPAPPAS